MSGQYSAKKTVGKAVEAPVVVVVGGLLMQRGLGAIGIEIDLSIAMGAAVAVYGAIKGIANRIKNRWRD